MAIPTTRATFKDYCLRNLGFGVIDINVSDAQVDDRIDEALQYFAQYHYDGIEKMYLKYKITQDDIDRGRARGGNNPVGIVTTTATSTVGISSTFSFEENSNFLQIPPAVLGINKIFRFDGSNTVTNNMFSVKYQLFLNDVYTFSSTEILSYAMTKRYLEDLDFALGTEKYIRFNKRQDRLYLDFDWGAASKDDYLIIEDSDSKQDIIAEFAAEKDSKYKLDQFFLDFWGATVLHRNN